MAKRNSHNVYKSLGLFGAFLIMLGTMLLSLVYGATPISWQTAAESFTSYDSSSMEHIILRTTRLPRACIAAAIGASLAIAGALMQALTRNAMASPSVLGINAGATFAVVLAITVFSIGSMQRLLWFSFAGALLAAAAVYLLGSLGSRGMTPLKIILAGSAMSALFASLTQGLLVHNENGLNDVLFWLTGSIAGRSLSMLVAVLPYLGGGWLAACLLARQMNVLAMGEEAAAGLGQRTVVVKLITGVIVVMLAGGSVAVAGPIALIGIIVPHVVRFLVGIDYRWIIPYSALLGAALLLSADVLARFIIMPEEVPVGIMTAAIGTPFFLYLARRRRMTA